MIINNLIDEEHLKEYENYIKSKQEIYLKCLISMFKMHIKRKTNNYPNRVLKIQMIKKELRNREV